MLLVPPATLTPGKLCIKYITLGITHEVCANYQLGFDPSDLGEVNGVASAFATKLKDMLLTTASIIGYRSATYEGVTILEGSFGPAIAGTFAGSGTTVGSQSATVSLGGKGNPGGGLRGGLVKLTVFPGYMEPTMWGEPHVLLAPVPGAVNMREYLETSDSLGADFYGSNAIWRGYANTQINAHYQKRIGF